MKKLYAINHSFNFINKIAISILFMAISTYCSAQTSYVEVSVNWPNWSSENRVEVYNPGGTLLATIDNGYNGSTNNSYSTTLSLNCLTNANNYYIIMYDTYGDGWNGTNPNVIITAGGTTVLANSGATASQTGASLNFNVSGTCSGSCTSTVNTFPHTESFETDLGLWSQDNSDGFNWTRHSNGTPSSGTGPNSASDGNFYIYTEATNNFNNNSNLISPCYNLGSVSSAQLTFNYHMFGLEMGSLRVDISTNSGLSFPTTIWSQNGQSQISNAAPWSIATIDLSAYAGQTIVLRIAGNTGTGYRSDIAVDNITVNAINVPEAEINITGNSIDISNGDFTTNTANNTDFGPVEEIIGSNSNTFTIENQGTTFPLYLTGTSPYVTITGTHASDFSLTSTPNQTINAGSSTTFEITFHPSSAGIKTALISIANNDSNENPYTFSIQGRGFTPLTEGPGGVTANLELWLKANHGAGNTDNQPLTQWLDQANSNDATVNITGQEPTYRDNPNFNVNYNPVVDFDSSYTLSPTDNDYSFDDVSGDFLQGSTGFFSQDIFAVVLPDVAINSTFGNMDLFCGDEDIATNTEDVTGLGFGRYSARFTDESFSYCVGSTTQDPPYVGYGVADTSTTMNYSNVGILNARNNTAISRQELYYNANNVETVQNDLPDFSNVNNSRYWLGRSEGYEAATNARIVEVISYSSRKNDTNLLDERNKIQSYLAIKYGITLGTNGTSQDYVDSNASKIWDVSANSGYNFDIAGIGRDDVSELYQKQSKSVNSTAIVSFALHNTELTNNLNTQTFDTDNEFLIWGNDGQNTNSSSTNIAVNLGTATVTTVTDIMNRKWKIVETAGDVSKVEVSVFQNDLAGLPALTGGDAYVMLVADDANFTSNLATVFLDPNTFNGTATLEGTYDFDGTKYFTFGIAHEEITNRHLGFDGEDNFTLVGNKIDLGGSFTASAWVKLDGSNNLATDKTIVAKSNGTTGYRFFITDSNILSFAVGTSASDRINSNTTIPNNVWHHVSVTYSSNEARLYIDGVLDKVQILNAPTPNGSDFSIGAIYVDKTNVIDYFKGDIDEIRIWNTALTNNQLRYVMNQELENATNYVNGTVVPNNITKNEIEVVSWNNLLAYYNMNSYIGTHLNDVSGNGNRGTLTNTNKFSIEYQSAPLPYTTATNGDWNTNTTWTNGTEQYIPGSASIVDSNITIDWNIVKTSHNLTFENSSLPQDNNNNRTLLSLTVDANNLTINGNTLTNEGNALTVTHYLKIHGKIDLQGESQLIQTLNSDLDPLSSGTLERDQQGTQDLYTYNYWSSPVGLGNNSTNNNSYTVPQIFQDGTDPNNPLAINFITNSYDGTSGSPIGIADYWIWKYGNLANNYYNWEHLRSTGTLQAGEGFTMKGVANTNNNVLLTQNYVLEGKPNNGEITLHIDPANEYLVGNPYASAIDANIFIADNPNTNGTLYFWEHWGGNSHVTSNYQGGYATYNLSGAIPAMQYDYNTNGNTGTGNANKIPGRYIPVSQGFFVTGSNSGNIVFNNNQRVFEIEGANSTFIRNAPSNSTSTTALQDERMKIRLSLNTTCTYKRQILVTVDDNATPQIDFGYDGELNETHEDDMYWVIDNKKFLIQGINIIKASTILPIGLHTDVNGISTFKIEELTNVPNDLDIFIYDAVTGTYNDIKNNPGFSINLPAGSYMDRFELRFSNGNSLSTEDYLAQTGIQFYFTNNNESIIINNPKLQPIKSVSLINMLGQEIIYFDAIETQDYTTLKTSNISSGNYILNINTNIGKIAKKVLIE